MKFKTWLESKRDRTHVYHASPESGLYVIRPHGKRKGTHSRKQPSAGIYVAPSFKDAVNWSASYVVWKKRSGGNLGSYREITIYKLRVPKEVIGRSWSEDWWEKEYFIVEDDLPTVEIISSKKFTHGEINGISGRQRNKAHQQRTARYKPMRAAKELQLTNLAAKEWLRLKDVIVDRVFKADMAKDRKERINDLMGQLQDLFTGDWWENKDPVAKLSPQDEAKARQLIQNIESLLGG